MPNHKSVSVIIPVYNVEDYLERCIRSVITQSYPYLDIVLVDDGSMDKSVLICQKWAERDNRITYLRQDNAGLGPARNRGIAATHSDYITFLDSDDWLEPEFIEKIVNAMISDNSDVGQCDIYYVDSVHMLRHPVKLRYDSNIVSCIKDKSVVNKSRLFAWGKIFKRDLFERCKFSFPDIAFEDTCIPAIIASANQISYISEPLINYLRNRPDSLSNRSCKIGDIATGLQLLYEKMNELSLYLDYELEYKKIVLGQLRFAYRKWFDTDNDAIVDALMKLKQFTVSLFPKLEYVMKEQFYAFDNELLKTALDYVIPQKHQLSTNIDNTDCIVAFEQDVPFITKTNVRILKIPAYTKNINDPVSAAFDIAEKIMERL